MSLPKPFYEDGSVTIYHGDCREILPEIKGVGCTVTSPPYWRQRLYGNHGMEHGAEETPEAYVDDMAELFGTVHAAASEDGSLWLNLGDKYAAGGLGGGGNRGDRKCWQGIAGRNGFRNAPDGYKPKDLTLLPFKVAERLRADGWYLRQVIVWAKPSGVEPLRADRPSVSHEYVFQLTKSERSNVVSPGESWWNLSVWNIRSDGAGDHPAAMPYELARRMVVSGSGTVLDPFMGSGTTLRAAKDLGRKAIGIDLDEGYCEIAAERCSQEVLDLGAAA